MKPLLGLNPAYDGHLIANEIYFYTTMDDRLKQHCSDATVWIISTPQCLKSIGLRPSRKIPILNNSLECSFRKYELYRGSKKHSMENEG